MRSLVVVLGGLIVSTLAHAQPAATQPAPDRTLVLDETGYFRRYHEFSLMQVSGEALRAEGQKLLGTTGLKRLQREARRLLKGKGIDWSTTDWTRQACVHFRRTQQGDDTRAVQMIETVGPPAGWKGPAFDDSTWLRQRLGRLPKTRHMKEAFDMSSLLVRGTCFRTYFQVPDPAAGELTLRLAYRGGARVFVNGVEVARGHLSADGARGEDYPMSAYVALPDEVPPGRGAGIFGDIRCAYDEAPPARRKEWQGFRNAASRQPINRKGWDRLRSLRDRTLGPVPIPARLLRKGPNVLAVEIRGSHFHPIILPGAGQPAADNWARHGGTENFAWDHARLIGIELRCPPGAVPSGLRRPAGMQLWAEDMHARVFSPDFNPPGWPAGRVRIVAARNGTYSAQVVVGTDRELTGLSASVGELKRVGGGAALPASAVKVSGMVGHPITQLFQLGHERCLGLYHWNAPMALSAAYRYVYTPHVLKRLPAQPKARQQALDGLLEELKFFDQIGPEPVQTVAAGTCRPIWISLAVPAETPAGTYRGQVTVRADAARAESLPVEVEVIDWRVPAPAEFQSIVESEQSPYGVAKHYKLKLWSQPHWRLMESSFRQLARLGNDWVFVPVLLNSELGNRGDSMIKWIRKPDGALAFDYAIMDRYLDLAVRCLGRPRVICFVIMHGVGSRTNAVEILDEASGKAEIADVGPNSPASRRPLWRAFATSLQAHMRRKGLERSMHWGHAFDRVYDPGLVALMAELTPGIPWAAGAHGRRPDATFRAVARAYGSDVIERSLKGWKNPFVHLLMPRTNGSVICVEGTSTPFTYRVMCDRAIYCGFNGIGRMGADYFDRAWFDGFSGGEYLLVGRSCVQTLWPGREAIVSGARNEAMLEGIQEAEARIFLEQALDRGVLGEELAAEVQRVLDGHFRSTLYIPGGTAGHTMMEYHGDWQGRSRRLYQTAAKVAERVGVDVDRLEIGTQRLETFYFGQKGEVFTGSGVPLPARGTAEVAVTLRNWTAGPRAWTAATTQPWIRPKRARGSLTGQEALPITLDGAGLSAGRTVAGEVTITDVSSGRGYPVRIAARVVKPLDFVVNRPVFNVTVGGAEGRNFLLVNRTSSQQSWKIESSVAWVKVAPAGGALEPGGSTFVKITVRPADAAAAVYQTKLTLTAEGAGVREEAALKTFVIPPYRRPGRLPAGRPVPLSSVSKQLLASHRSIGWFQKDRIHSAPTFGPTLNVWHEHQPLVIGEKTYQDGMWVKPYHQTVYRLQGAGYAGFSAEVGWNRMVTRSSMGAGHTTVKVSFEIHVDGRIVAQSGLMKATDPARLLVVEGLEGAGQLKLVTRTDQDADEPLGVAYCNWADAKLYKRQ